MTVANAPEVLEIFDHANVIAVLQGHTHVNEIVAYKNTQYITSGAVCGNWWHGPRLRAPHPRRLLSNQPPRRQSIVRATKPTASTYSIL